MKKQRKMIKKKIIRSKIALLLCTALIVFSFSACSIYKKSDGAGINETQKKTIAEQEKDSKDKAASTEKSGSSATKSDSEKGTDKTQNTTESQPQSNTTQADQGNGSQQEAMGQGTEITNSAGDNNAGNPSGGTDSGNAAENLSDGSIELPAVDIPVTVEDPGAGAAGTQPSGTDAGNEAQSGEQGSIPENETPMDADDSGNSGSGDIFVDDDGAIELPEVPID